MSAAFVPQRGQDLASLTSLRLGGPAEFFARLASVDQLRQALSWASARGLPVTVLGGGSNVVVADAGVRGLVVQLGLSGAAVANRASGGAVEVSVGAGVVWDDFVNRCVTRGWAGLECLSGIPGLVGATPIQNVGAYGQEVGDTLVEVEAYEPGSDRVVRLSRAECRFGYRTSRFKADDAGRFVVLRVSFELLPGGRPRLVYPDLARAFPGGSGANATLAEVRAAVLAVRRRKSMLLDRDDENGRSCGSFFVNPELAPDEFDALRARCPAQPPNFVQPDGRRKVPAAWLIEHAGFERGQRWGRVGISTRHCLALVCHSGATSSELVAAAHRIRDGVAQRCGVWLRPEPRFIGFDQLHDGLPPAR